MRLQLAAKRCPRRNTVKHGQRFKPRQHDLGLCGDEGGQLTENAAHFPFNFKIRHFDRIVQLNEFARLDKYRRSAGRHVMDDPWNPSPHVGFHRNDIAAFSLSESTVPGECPHNGVSGASDLLDRRICCLSPCA